jgi:catechol 2,3-dioxygenase-like lactoylglutathione lyase family enzyme
MIDHTGVGVANVAQSARFYDAALGTLGLRRVMQMPENVGTDGIGYGVEYPVFWIDFTRILFASILHSRRRIELRSTPFLALHSGKAELTMGHPASAGRSTTLRLSLIPTATTSRQSFAASDTV